MTSLLCGIIPDIFVKLSPYPLASAHFIDAQVIDVKSLDIREYIASGVLFEHAEGITFDRSVIVFINKHGTQVIIKERIELSVVVLTASGFEKIRAYRIMNGKNLLEQSSYTGYITAYGASYYRQCQLPRYL